MEAGPRREESSILEQTLTMPSRIEDTPMNKYDLITQINASHAELVGKGLRLPETPLGV